MRLGAYEPAEQQVLVELLHKLALRPHGVEREHSQYDSEILGRVFSGASVGGCRFAAKGSGMLDHERT